MQRECYETDYTPNKSINQLYPLCDFVYLVTPEAPSPGHISHLLAPSYLPSYYSDTCTDLPLAVEAASQGAAIIHNSATNVSSTQVHVTSPAEAAQFDII